MEKDIETDDLQSKRTADKDNTQAEKKPAPKKKKKDAEGSVNNTIEINPTLDDTLKEAASDTVVLGWGRMNPITTGHEKLANKVTQVARQNKGTPKIYLTHSEDPKKNPLSYEDKISLAQKAFGNIIVKSKAKTIIQVMQELQKKHKKVVLVVGSDRVQQFETLLNKYNGKDYTFDSIDVVSAGERDPDADDVSGMSASKMRALAAQGNEKEFAKGLPAKLKKDASKVFDMVRQGMKLAEELEAQGLLDEAVLTYAQRRQRGLVMRKYKNRIKLARKRAMRKAATMDKLKMRARKKAINIIRQKVAGKKGMDYAKLSPGEKMLIDKRVAKKKAVIDRIAKRMIPQVRKMDLERLASKSKVNEDFELFFEASQADEQPKKRYHEARKKDGSMKFDGRFRAFRNKVEEESEYEKTVDDHKSERDAMKRRHKSEVIDAKRRDLTRQAQEESYVSFETDAELMEWVDAVSTELFESIEREEQKEADALYEKSEKSGHDFETIYKVYVEGVNQWDDTRDITPQQLGFARVNHFIANNKIVQEEKMKPTITKESFKDIIKQNIEEGVNDPGIFKAVFLAGGPGSGKSFIVGKTALQSFGLKLINSDDAFEAALKKVGLKPTPEDIFSPKGQEVRGRAKALTKAKQTLAMNGRLGLVIDGTGKDYGKIAKQAAALRGLGYETAMIFVNTDLDTAQARNAARARTLPADEVEKMWKDVQKNIGKFQNFFGRNMYVLDNSEGAEWEGAVNSAYKRIGAWVKDTPKNPTAKKWIKDAKAERGIKEETLEEAIRDRRSYEAGKAAARAGKKYGDNPMPKGSQAYLDWSKGHNAARASKLGMREGLQIDEALEVKLRGGKVPVGQHRFKYNVDKSDKYIENSIKERDPKATVERKGNDLWVTASAQAHSSVIAGMRRFRVNGTVSEHVELDEAKSHPAADELSKYAVKSGGVDKKDFQKAAGYLNNYTSSGSPRAIADIVKLVKDLDTDPRDKILLTINKHDRSLATTIMRKAGMSMREHAELQEKLKVSDGLGAWIKDFQDSDAPQFQGKDKEKRRKMAIAAFADAGGDLNEDFENFLMGPES